MKALVCSTRMPEYDRECGSKRTFDVIRFLRDAGWNVVYVAREAEAYDRYARALRQDGIPALVGFDTLSDDFLAQSRFDVAILAFWHVAEDCLPRIRRASPGTRVIIDSIDLHFLRSTRRAFTPDRAAGTTAPTLGNLGDEFVREVRIYAAADGILAVSSKEAGLIGDLIGDPDAVRCVPLCQELPRSTIAAADRRGLLFIGNFWHQPNVDAVNYLVDDILPRVNPALLSQHPLSIVGHASETRAGALRVTPNVTVVGWVPSVLPYLARARVVTVPLRYGAGTKGKLIQALGVGTPVVSTAVGTEGLDLRHGRELLVANDPAAFAGAIQTLLTSDALWSSVADHGHAHVVRGHSEEVVTESLLAALDDFVARPPKPFPSDDAQNSVTAYEQMRERTVAAIGHAVPPGSAVAVINKGDEAFLRIDGRQGEHFPQLPDGRYAGSYPADGRAAVESVERLRSRGVDFLAIPRTSSWWVDHYKDLAVHLARASEIVFHSDDCTIYSLTRGATHHTPAAASTATGSRVRKKRFSPPSSIEELRPSIVDVGARLDGANLPRPRVLLCGIYLCGQRNNAADEIATLGASRHCDVDQRWVALGGPAPPDLADVTVTSVSKPTPKFDVLNRLIAATRLADYDYLVLIDDDIVLPHGFLDAFIRWQRKLEFALAQPARTHDSYLDHPIVELQRGVIARQTQFVEIGPVVSMHCSVFDLLLPFDLTSSMGWGYENVWAYRLQERGLKMGIIDAVPVCHGLRKSATHYSWHTADAERTAYWAKHPHLPLDECFRVLDIVGLPEAPHA
jgi:glycosyltransferase involved in cell wall biosynthesis